MGLEKVCPWNFMVNFHLSKAFYVIIVVVDRSNKMVHFIPNVDIAMV
jgi:PII-like signaling protein